MFGRGVVLCHSEKWLEFRKKHRWPSPPEVSRDGLSGPRANVERTKLANLWIENGVNAKKSGRWQDGMCSLGPTCGGPRWHVRAGKRSMSLGGGGTYPGKGELKPHPEAGPASMGACPPAHSPSWTSRVGRWRAGARRGKRGCGGQEGTSDETKIEQMKKMESLFPIFLAPVSGDHSNMDSKTYMTDLE